MSLAAANNLNSDLNCTHREREYSLYCCQAAVVCCDSFQVTVKHIALNTTRPLALLSLTEDMQVCVAWQEACNSLGRRVFQGS